MADALRILEQLGVQLNPAKTRIVQVRFGFEFLGYQIKRGRPRQLGNRKLGKTAPAGTLYAYPREKSILRFKEQVRQLTSRRAPVTTQELIDELNPILRGWGTTTKGLTFESSLPNSMHGSCVASGRTDANAGAAVAGDSCRRRGCMARWGLLVCWHFTFARAHPAGTLRESCMRENCTCSLSGGRRPACSSDRAPPPTRLRVKGKWTYLYRAVDSAGATIEFLLAARRDAAAAQRFFQNALLAPGHTRPRVINVDGNPSYPKAVSELKQEGKLGRRCRCRTCPYLNHIVEQDHRAIKRRVNASQGFRSFHSARRTIQGYEVVHMIRKGQVTWLPKGDVLGLIRFLNEILGLSAE